jgi:hypothetical protein
MAEIFRFGGMCYLHLQGRTALKKETVCSFPQTPVKIFATTQIIANVWCTSAFALPMGDRKFCFHADLVLQTNLNGSPAYPKGETLSSS